MNLEIITIGNELLIGQVVDTNSAWMGQQLNKEGFDIVRITSVQDTVDAIKASLDEALSRVDIVLMTGGLGPTKDDITKQTLADYFDSKLVFNQDVYDNVCTLLKGRVKNINELNRGQALVPDKCTVINNPVGTAPVMWFEKDGKVVVSMPGVPGEMKHAVNNEIIPRLKERYETQHIIHKTVLIFNIPEAVLAEQLSSWEETIPGYISLAYLPSPGKIRLRLTAKTLDDSKAHKDIENLVKSLYPIVGDNIFAEEDKPVHQLLGEMLKKEGKTIATAESCTGGYIGHLLTSIPGSSVYFRGGIIAYENEIKERLLGVCKNDLLKYGAVSQPVVEQMALGAKKVLGTDYSIATSGIAGPDGGSEEKPVGTVWIAIAGDFGVISQKYQFGKMRERNIHRSADTGMVMLFQQLTNSLR
ncbi:competence/damage-inducible protein A [Carboxylicivirga linearis]|uniref:CinA-like protein n=1 Tax=Carboxylicivirga linearis TaxID=1628157 RepID=A0ABS5JRF8_9BACT|nr:competence/damage-inducible protein A [Carboxylicivirga linearis]MBS2097400.1 competence/damage-inducible protein A [Carboxylicivirga linearis]